MAASVFTGLQWHGGAWKGARQWLPPAPVGGRAKAWQSCVLKGPQPCLAPAPNSEDESGLAPSLVPSPGPGPAWTTRAGWLNEQMVAATQGSARGERSRVQSSEARFLGKQQCLGVRDRDTGPQQPRCKATFYPY